ncbi:FecR family protein [Chitinophaga defluvii]|uniref:FecR domain-containing protein n=1 Tax=Chitinophaga defluvii TaxID=3163343 RepID=A0ABV2T2C8_9BACT
MQNQENITRLFHKYLANQCTPGEVDELMQSLRKPEYQSIWEELVAAQVAGTTASSQEPDEVVKARLEQRLQNILHEIEESPVPVYTRKIVPYTWKWAAAAAILILLGTGTYFYLNSPTKQVVHTPAVAMDVAPGGNKATLTLSNGSVVLIDSVPEGKVAQQGNTSIVKLPNGQLVYNAGNSGVDESMYNTLATPRGGQYQLTLPDGTQVWLDAASSITYPAVFKGNKREVTITGEAYFEIALNAAKPFFVKVKEATIQVLGTHFNVNAYQEEEAIKVSLLQGAVKLNNKKSGIRLVPGQQGQLFPDGALKLIKEVDVEQAIAWKNGYFQFDGIGLPALIRQIARWYDLDVVYEGAVPEREFSGKIARTAYLSDVIKALELSDVHCRFDGKKLIVMP